jgi:hypothetical protein
MIFLAAVLGMLVASFYNLPPARHHSAYDRSTEKSHRNGGSAYSGRRRPQPAGPCKLLRSDLWCYKRVALTWMCIVAFQGRTHGSNGRNA